MITQLLMRFIGSARRFLRNTTAICTHSFAIYVLEQKQQRALVRRSIHRRRGWIEPIRTSNRSPRDNRALLRLSPRISISIQSSANPEDPVGQQLLIRRVGAGFHVVAEGGAEDAGAVVVVDPGYRVNFSRD